MKTCCWQSCKCQHYSLDSSVFGLKIKKNANSDLLIVEDEVENVVIDWVLLMEQELHAIMISAAQTLIHLTILKSFNSQEGHSNS